MYNRSFATAALVAVIASTSAFGVLAQGTNPAPPPGGRHPRRNRTERHPEIRKAGRELEAALRTMSQANSDFGGHKEAAMDLTRRALAELKQALQSDHK